MTTPCVPSVLSRNPQFAALHQHLTTKILNPDGSSQTLDADPSSRAVHNDLQKYLVRVLRTRLIRRAITQLASEPDSGLSEDTQELLAIVSIYFHQPDITAEDQTLLPLLVPDLDRFRGRLNEIAPGLGRIVQAELDGVRKMVDELEEVNFEALAAADDRGATIGASTTRPVRGSGSRPTATTTSQITRTRTGTITAADTSNTNKSSSTSTSAKLASYQAALDYAASTLLPRAHSSVTTAAATFAVATTTALEFRIRALEHYKHGNPARLHRTRAAYLTAVAAATHAQIRGDRANLWRRLYTPDMTATLEAYSGRLSEVEGRLEGRRRTALKELERYEMANLPDGNSKGSGDDVTRVEEGEDETASGMMAVLARRYEMLLREADEIDGEMDRLRTSAGVRS